MSYLLPDGCISNVQTGYKGALVIIFLQWFSKEIYFIAPVPGAPEAPEWSAL